MTPIYPSETLRRCCGVGDLAGADRIMNEAVFIGTYPGLTPAMLDYMVDTIRTFVKKF